MTYCLLPPISIGCAASEASRTPPARSPVLVMQSGSLAPLAVGLVSLAVVSPLLLCTSLFSSLVSLRFANFLFSRQKTLSPKNAAQRASDDNDKGAARTRYAWLRIIVPAWYRLA